MALQIAFELDNMDSGDEQDEAILRWSRRGSFLMGGCVHKSLTGKTQKQLKAEKDEAKKKAMQEREFADFLAALEEADASGNAPDYTPNAYMMAAEAYDYGDSDYLLFDAEDEEYEREAGYHYDIDD